MAHRWSVSLCPCALNSSCVASGWVHQNPDWSVCGLPEAYIINQDSLTYSKVTSALSLDFSVPWGWLVSYQGILMALNGWSALQQVKFECCVSSCKSCIHWLISCLGGERKMSCPLSEDPVEMGAQTVGRTDGNVDLSWLHENKMTKISSCSVFSGIRRCFVGTSVLCRCSSVIRMLLLKLHHLSVFDIIQLLRPLWVLLYSGMKWANLPSCTMF